MQIRLWSVKRVIAASVTGLLLVMAETGRAAPPQPVAAVRPITDVYFGNKVVDNYRYFEDANNTEAQVWMKAQAAYTRKTLDSLPGYGPLLKRIAELDASEPAQVRDVQIVAGRYYSLRTPSGSQSPKLYVRENLSGQDRLLVDPEELAKDAHTHLSIHDYRPSPDGRYIAYQLAAGGSEDSVLHILDVRAGRDMPETADRMDEDIAAPFWRTDSRSFFYSREQKVAAGEPASAKRENKHVYLHVIGRSFDTDAAIFGRNAGDTAIAMTPAEYPEILTVPGSHYAIAYISQGTDPRLRIYAAPIDSLQEGKTHWRPIAASYDDQYIGGDNADYPVIALSGDTLYWLSRKHASRGEILKIELARAGSSPQIVVASGDLPISAVYAGRDAIYWRINDAGVCSVRRLKLAASAKSEQVSLPYAGNVNLVTTDNAGSAALLSATSWLRSPTYLSVDPASGAATDRGVKPIGAFDHADDLTAEELRVKSWDGTEVPLSIVHKKDMPLDGGNLTVIAGYGAYGISASPFYIPALQRAIYDRGGVFAFAHVRGGGELGESWHQAGFQTSKPNTWKDFIACAQYLIDHQYSNPRKLVGLGNSAGGILIGRAIEERPDLFAASWIHVPMVDPLRGESTADGPDNIAEFGTVKTEAGFKALYAMSPYAHVQDGVKYPAVIIYAGANDPRVPAWEPAKFAARLQAATASGKPVLLRVDYDAGHGFDATRHQVDLDFADEIAFALWQTGDPQFQP